MTNYTFDLIRKRITKPLELKSEIQSIKSYRFSSAIKFDENEVTMELKWNGSRHYGHFTFFFSEKGLENDFHFITTIKSKHDESKEYELIDEQELLDFLGIGR